MQALYQHSLPDPCDFHEPGRERGAQHVVADALSVRQEECGGSAQFSAQATEATIRTIRTISCDGGMIVSVVYDINRSRTGQGEIDLDIVVIRQTLSNLMSWPSNCNSPLN